MGKKQDIAKRKQELTSALAKNRVLITVGKGQIKEKLNVKSQLTRIVKRKPKALFIGSVVAGLVTTLLLRRKKVVSRKKDSTKSTLLLGWALTIMKPAAKAWLVSRAKNLATSKLQPQKRPSANPDLSSSV